MKKLLGLIAIFYWCSASIGQSLHSLSFLDIDGATVNLSTYQGKKILIFLAPIHKRDSSRIKEIDSIRNVYDTNISCIGVMSIEDGYLDSNKTAIKALYQGTGIKLTQGMYTRKTSGSNQSDLMNWLTTRTRNMRSNADARAIGDKFFIGKTGKVYEVVSAEVPFDSDIVKITILRRN